MFKIIDSIGNPIKLPDWGGELKPGHIVKMATFKCCPVFLLGDSEKPFGVVSEADGIHASVYCGDILFQTDNFELDQTYKREIYYIQMIVVFLLPEKKVGMLFF